MKVWIVWSGKTSKEVASILKSWFPLMNRCIETFFSAEDISEAMIRHDEFTRNVVECDCALFCLTSDNIHSPWLYYELGMLHNMKNVILLLFDVPFYRLDGPFRNFQAETFDEDSLWRITSFLNELCWRDAVSIPLSTKELPVSTKELENRFVELYPTMKKMLAQVRVSQKERLRENQSEQGAEDLKREQDFATVNRKLDTILSRLSQTYPNDSTYPGSSYPRQENSL